MEGLTRIESAGSRACSAGSDPYLPIGIYAAAAPTADHPRQEALRYRVPKRLEPGLLL